MSSDDSILPFITTCLAGDKKSWDYLRTRSLKQLRSQYASLAQDHEDVAQEIAIKLTGGLRQFRGATKYEFEEYLGTIIHNTAESYRCRPSRQPVAAEMNTKESRRLQGLVDSDADDPMFPPDPSPLPLEQQQDSRLSPERITEIRDLCAKAGALLSVRDMRIVLYKADGYQDREIADILGMSAGGVAATYSRIKELLRRTLVLLFIALYFERKLLWAKSLWI